MIRKRETAQQLRKRIEDALVRDVGVSPAMAQPFVNSVLRCFAGEQPYFPTKQRDYPILEIRDALARGMPVSKVVLKFGVSKTQLYRLLHRSEGERTKSG